MRRFLLRAAVIPAALLTLVSCAAPGSGRVTLSNFVYDRARVETLVTSFPDCELRVGMTVTSFELPLNGTRVIDTPAGSDVCWRRIEPPFAEAPVFDGAPDQAISDRNTTLPSPSPASAPIIASSRLSVNN